MSPARKKTSKSPRKAVTRKKTAAPRKISAAKKTAVRKSSAKAKPKTHQPKTRDPKAAQAPAAPPAPAAVIIGRPQQLEHGTQPLDELMTRFGLSNAHLVNASTEQITFKMVHKARRGRHLTPKIKTKILNALHNCLPDETFAHRQLFSY